MEERMDQMDVYLNELQDKGANNDSTVMEPT